MDIEQQKKNVWQAGIVFAVFLILSLFMFEEIWYSWVLIEAHGGWLNIGALKFYAVLIFSIPITIFYAILSLLRFLKLKKMKRQS